LLRISPTTGQTVVEAEDLPVGLLPTPGPIGHATTPGVADRPAPFADIAVAPDGSLLVSADGEGSVLRLSPGVTSSPSLSNTTVTVSSSPS
jgi:hypothetical protein